MKRFLAIYTGNISAQERSGWDQLSDVDRNKRMKAGMDAWMAWGEKHEAAIVENGDPLGKTKRTGLNGVTDIKNALAGWVLVQADSHEAAAKMFEGHPHFTIFPGDSVEIMECLPIPAVHIGAMDAQQITIRLDGNATVSGLWLAPDDVRAAYVFAHGAGAGMAHKSMVAIAEGLAARGIATLRYNFLYMERGSKRPDAPAVAHAAVRAAVGEAAGLAALPLFAGGKSFGGRMTSQAQAASPLPGVRGLVFFAFPLHPAGKPGDERAKHLADVKLPMLFLQGENDALASLDLLRPVVARLGERATLTLFDDADHSFHVPARTGKKDADVLTEALDITAEWMIARAG